MQGKKILVIDDDADLLRLLEIIFSEAGADVVAAASGEEGLRQFSAGRPDLIILDVMMPDMDGWETCARLALLSNVPIIFLTVLVDQHEIIRGLDCGAVDYLTKPFDPPVLLARARAALRQAALASEQEMPVTYHDGYLAVDTDQRRVLVRGQPVSLTVIEYQVIALLVQNPGRVLTHQKILEHVWGPEFQDSVNYVHVYIRHLRLKLERDPSRPTYIHTVRGTGYRFEAQAPLSPTSGEAGSPSSPR